jgi:Sec-independent protein secretion pathway component TatC
MAEYRRYFYLISVIVIALITPTTDAVTLSSMFIPSVIIYEGRFF